MAKKMTRFEVQKDDWWGDYYVYGKTNHAEGLLGKDGKNFVFSRKRDAIRGFTRFVNRQKLSNVVLEVEGTEIVYI